MRDARDAAVASGRVARAVVADAAVAAGLFAGALAVYALTLCPGVYIGDAGELTAVAVCFGVAHPPGYPLFTLLYGGLLHLLAATAAVEPALAANAITAAIAAAAVAVVFVAARGLGLGRASAAAAAIGLAVARRWWMQAVSVEVYTLDGLLLALAFAASIALAVAPAPGWTRARFVRLGLAVGLCCGHRPMNALYAALLALWVERSRRHRRARAGAPAHWLAALVAAVATGVVYVYLPIAAAADPPLNMGDPDSLARFWAVVTAEPYQRHVQSGTFELAAARFGGALLDLPVQLAFTLAAACLGFVAARRDRGDPGRRGLALVLAGVAALNLAFASTYNILDVDGFFQPALLALALLAALGFDAFARARARGGAPARAPARAPACAPASAPASASASASASGRARPGLVLLLAALPAAWTWNEASLAGVDATERYARDLLRAAAPRSLVLVQGDTPRAALCWLQVARGERRDVAVLAPGMLIPWHVGEVRARSPDSGLPPLREGDDPQAWLRGAVRAVLQDRRAVYFASAEAAPLELILEQDWLPRATLVPAGLMTRVAFAPPSAADIDQAARFWDDTAIPALPTARRDPQLEILPVQYAEARLVLAAALLQQGNARGATAHLEAVAASDCDAREASVAAAYRGIGRNLTPRRFAARSRAALEALGAGATPEQALGALAPR